MYAGFNLKFLVRPLTIYPSGYGQGKVVFATEKSKGALPLNGCLRGLFLSHYDTMFEKP